VEPTGTTDIDGLSAIISDQSTGSRPDVYLVILGLLDAINQELADGRKVQLGKLGTFSLSVTSEGEETPQEVTASSIKKARIIYRPGAETRAMLKTLQYEKNHNSGVSLKPSEQCPCIISIFHPEHASVFCRALKKCFNNMLHITLVTCSLLL